MAKFVAVWGFASTGSPVGELGRFAALREANECVVSWLASQDDPAIGAWVEVLPAETV